eukprot:m51a1_g5622 putative homeobox transcription factor (240) ;mRNA; r:776638-777618
MEYTVSTTPAPYDATTIAQSPPSTVHAVPSAAALAAAEAVVALLPHELPARIASTPGLSSPAKRQSPDLSEYYDDDSDIEPALMLLKLSQSPAVHKRKRQRTSPEQLDLLEQMFEQNTMPNQQTRLTLAAQLGMSARRIQIWFQNKRAKVRRSRLRASSEDALAELSRQSLERLSGAEDDMSDAESVAQPASPSRPVSPASHAAFLTPVPIAGSAVVLPILVDGQSVSVSPAVSPAPRQ